jgi:predicted restriction endonuclease
MAEASEIFVAAPADEAAMALLSRVWNQVLVAYDNRCAVTGDGDPSPVAIRPRPDGGPLRVSNFICLSPVAEAAFASGAIAIGRDHEVLVNLALIDANLLEHLNPRLVLPRDAAEQPSKAALAWHRTNVFRGGK